MFWWDDHHPSDGHPPITNFSTIYEFNSQIFLPDRNFAKKCGGTKTIRAGGAENLIPKLIDDQAKHSSKTYCKTREYLHLKGTLHYKKTGYKSSLSVLKYS